MSQVQWADIEPGLCMGYSGLFARLDDVAKLGSSTLTAVNIKVEHSCQAAMWMRRRLCKHRIG